ncbi:GDP-L-fucose synthase [Salegentibacter sp. JZCK2]|uniref:GDP-L-fucose synthase family protein n=1 Tax=Salegentibacter tibetensis TaxID=2873600 RepID=UPI001CCF5240|nr:GDP-L-fucose synthase [Salegentibacter tibetensis]MBZ9729725.1 GDP-L-fucose synthase [Salegentibacter tibetensis]
MDRNKKIYIAGHRGMAGSAIWRKLSGAGYTNLLGRTSGELDLRDRIAVNRFFEEEGPEVVILAAAKVGGIWANNEFPYEFLIHNLQIQNNVIDAAHSYGIKKFIFLGSSCIFPKYSPQPIKEEYLLSGELEPTNQWYSLAKIAGIKACEALRRQYQKDFICLMPTNLYGPGDNFDLKTSHVLPAMLRKFHEAKGRDHAPVKLWGTGSPMREFMHVDDLASAVLFCLEHQLEETIYNVGTGKDLRIDELAVMIQQITGHSGEILWDASKPDGTPRKLLDVEKLKNKGWQAGIALEEGIKQTYKWYQESV